MHRKSRLPVSRTRDRTIDLAKPRVFTSLPSRASASVARSGPEATRPAPTRMAIPTRTPTPTRLRFRVRFPDSASAPDRRSQVGRWPVSPLGRHCPQRSRGGSRCAACGQARPSWRGCPQLHSSRVLCNDGHELAAHGASRGPGKCPTTSQSHLASRRGRRLAVSEHSGRAVTGAPTIRRDGGPTVSAAQATRLGALGLELGFDVYFTPKPD